MKTVIYVDGFNLYYGSLKRTQHKWLNLHEMCTNALQKHHVIHRIRYFTAFVKPRPGSQNHIHQQAYIRALRTLSTLHVHEGQYLTHVVRMPLAHPVPGGSKTVEVIKSEEKGSDVNLASWLLMDGFKKDYDCAVVVTNDSDLLEPIRLVREELNLKVGILNPHPTTAYSLKNVAHFSLQIKEKHLSVSQFPSVVTDSQGGKIAKPYDW